MPLLRLIALAIGLLLCPGQPAQAVTEGQGALCQQAVARAETSRHLPDAFLAAIARVETGRPDPATGAAAPWPWSVNAEGSGTFYPSKTEAIAAVRALQARGVASIDVGCLQVNLLHHKAAFASLDQAFDPDANAAYAADFLRDLFTQTGSWPLAAAAYHSQTPGIGSAYQKRVLAEWAVPQNEPQPGRRAHSSRITAVAAPSLKPVQQASSRPAPQQMSGRTSLAAPLAAQFPLARPAGVTGRGLAAYRLLPTRLAFKG